MNIIVKSEPFHTQAYNLIKDEILTCKLRGGERVSENLLAGKLNISRSPVREAMRMLERDKLLVPSPNGMVVNPLPAAEVKEIYECRIMLESFAARLTAVCIDEKDIGVLEECIEQAGASHRADDTAAILHFNTTFHETIIALCGNTHLIDLNELNRGLTILARSRELHDYHRSPDYIGEHQSILDAFRKRDADLAEKAMRHHVINDMAFHMKFSQDAAGA